MIADYMPKDYSPYSLVIGEGASVSEGKLRMLAAGVFGFGIWGVGGFMLGGWTGAGQTLLGIGLIASVAHTFGSVFRYFSLPEKSPELEFQNNGDDTYFDLAPALPMSPEVEAALNAFREDTDLNPFGPPTQEEAQLRVLRDWLIGHSYLSKEYAELGMG